VRRTLLLAALGLLGCPGSPPPPSPSPRPAPAAGNAMNVLLITIDTLRADHLGAYGYRRPTSPRMDALAAQGTLFERAYTFWPKTRGSFVMMMTGRRPSQNGYSKSHPMIVGFNPTLASVLQEAGYETAAVVDNANVAAEYGFAKGFDSYRETWEEKASLVTEMDRTRAITEEGVRFLKASSPSRPFFLWLHYVNPHTPYTPPPPFDTAFLDADVRKGPRLPVVPGDHGGIPKKWAVTGRDRLGWYVAQYDGEIAAVDAEVGRVLDALEASAARGRTLVVLTSDHGESLGEHDYYFEHGENVFDPALAIPLLVSVPGGPAAQRSGVLASTLDLVPTILDAVKVSYPPDLAGTSLLTAVNGGSPPARTRLFAGNDRNLLATFDDRYKLVATPDDRGTRYALFDRRTDPGELREVSPSRSEELRAHRRELELFQERADREWANTRRLVQGVPGEAKMSPEACEQLKALNYVVAGCP
jgi:arylsulfatase A-like enzyme